MDSEHVYGVTTTPYHGLLPFVVFDAAHGWGQVVAHAVSREAAERLILCLKGG
jgi:hypothetical protein